MRKEFPYKLTDGKEYIFSERNKEDVDIYAIRERFRKHNFRFIQENVTNPDDRLSLLMHESHKDYQMPHKDELTGVTLPGDLGYYMSFDPEEQKYSLYDSFKIKNPDVKFDEFVKILPEDDMKGMIKLLNEIEKVEPPKAEVKKKKAENG
jgi:hypothetical protein